VNRYSFGTSPIFKIAALGILGLVAGGILGLFMTFAANSSPLLLFLDPIIGVSYWIYFSIYQTPLIPVLAVLIHALLGLTIAMWMGRKIVQI